MLTLNNMNHINVDFKDGPETEQKEFIYVL